MNESNYDHANHEEELKSSHDMASSMHEYYDSYQDSDGNRLSNPQNIFNAEKTDDNMLASSEYQPQTICGGCTPGGTLFNIREISIVKSQWHKSDSL